MTTLATSSRDPHGLQPARADGFDELDLLNRVRAGQPQACRDFVRAYAGRMLATARRFLRCEQDAADAVQDAFISAFGGLRSFESKSKLSTWLHRIVVNACLMRLRARGPERTTSIDSLLAAFDADGHHRTPIRPWRTAVDPARAAELREHVRACIDQLPDSYRTVLLLRDIEELDTDETACLLGASRANVKTRLHRARQALRTLLEPVLTSV